MFYGFATRNLHRQYINYHVNYKELLPKFDSGYTKVEPKPKPKQKQKQETLKDDILPTSLNMFDYFESIKIREPTWKSRARISGEAGELLFYKKMVCPNCNSRNLHKYGNNTPSKDFKCLECNQDYQIKNRGVYKKEYEKMISKNRIIKTGGGSYKKSISSIGKNIDYIFIFYDKRSGMIFNPLHAPSSLISEQNIKAENQLSTKTRQPGYEMCSLINVSFKKVIIL